MRLRSGLALGFMVVALASTALAQGGRPLSATLTGAAEAPGPGDPDGSGTAVIRLNQGQHEVCFDLTWSGIVTPTMAHIHRGPVGVAGPVVVTLFALPGDISESGCVEDVDKDLIKDIRQHPEEFYVNIHNAVFQAGAIRGQLHKGGDV